MGREGSGEVPPPRTGVVLGYSTKVGLRGGMGPREDLGRVMSRSPEGPYRVSRAAIETRAARDWLRLNPPAWEVYSVTDRVVMLEKRCGSPSEAAEVLERLRRFDGAGFIIETNRAQYDPADH